MGKKVLNLLALDAIRNEGYHFPQAALLDQDVLKNLEREMADQNLFYDKEFKQAFSKPAKDKKSL